MKIDKDEDNIDSPPEAREPGTEFSAWVDFLKLFFQYLCLSINLSSIQTAKVAPINPNTLRTIFHGLNESNIFMSTSPAFKMSNWR